MAGRFTAGGRTYPDTSAGRLLARKDETDAKLYLHGHRMKYWRKEASAPYFSAQCGNCGAGVKVVTGRAPMNLPGYPSLLRLGRVRWCPGKERR
jgi:hypothetical protein